MRFTVRAKAVANVNDVKTGLIKSRRIVFTPDTDLKEELQATAIQITCYDRDGNIVKRVTSADEGTVEDEDSPSPNSPEGNDNVNVNDNVNGNGNDNPGDNPGGDDDGSDED